MPRGADSLVSALNWLLFVEVAGARPTRDNFVRVLGVGQPKGFAEEALEKAITSGLVAEDGSGLHLTADGRQRLADAAARERGRQRPSN